MLFKVKNTPVYYFKKPLTFIHHARGLAAWPLVSRTVTGRSAVGEFFRP